MAQISSQPHRIIYKVALIIFLSFVACMLGFMGLVGYYLWQLKYGDPMALKRSIYQGQLSIDATKKYANLPVLPGNVSSYIRPYNPTLGDPNAPITILAFIDFECPYSQRSYPIFQKVVNEFKPAVRVIFKHFPITAIHPNGETAALAAACVQEQGKFWQYYEQLFEKKQLDSASLEQSARDIGVRIPTFSTCLTSEKYLKNIEQDREDVFAMGVRGTPTYFVNQTKVEGAITFADWQNIIVQELQKITK